MLIFIVSPADSLGMQLAEAAAPAAGLAVGHFSGARPGPVRSPGKGAEVNRLLSLEALSWTSGLTCTHVPSEEYFKPKCLTSSQPAHGMHGQVQFPFISRPWSHKSVPYGHLKG